MWTITNSRNQKWHKIQLPGTASAFRPAWWGRMTMCLNTAVEFLYQALVLSMNSWDAVVTLSAFWQQCCDNEATCQWALRVWTFETSSISTHCILLYFGPSNLFEIPILPGHQIPMVSIHDGAHCLLWESCLYLVFSSSPGHVTMLQISHKQFSP